MAKADLDSAAPSGTKMRQECLAIRARLISRRLSRIYDAALRPQRITVSQLNLLSVIENLQSAPAGRVAELLSMEISTLSRNARIAQDEGWITIERAERGNGRVLSLTPAGRQKLLQALPAWEHAQSEARSLLGPEAAETLWKVGNAVWDEHVDDSRTMS